jgi:hypothetical protein
MEEIMSFVTRTVLFFVICICIIPMAYAEGADCSGLSGTVYDGINYEGSDYGTPVTADSVCECAQLCNDDDKCKVVTYWYGKCYLKNDLDTTPIKGPAEANAASWVKGEKNIEKPVVKPNVNSDCSGLSGTVYDGINYEWNDYGTPEPADSVCECAQLCNDDDKCKVVTYWHGKCYLKNDLDPTPIKGPAEANAASWVKSGKKIIKPVSSETYVGNTLSNGMSWSWSNWNLGVVNNKPPTRDTTFTITEPVQLVYIDTYHWNNGNSLPSSGTIELIGDDGKMYGPWNTVGKNGQNNNKNAWWVATVNIILPAGTYTVVDSDPDTWSNNPESKNAGFAGVKWLE